MSGRATALQTNRRLADLAAEQSSVLTRSQLLELGVRPHHVHAQLVGCRWREVTTGVIALHTGPIAGPARRWVAVLTGGEGAALGSWTALELHGLVGWQRPALHIVVARGRHVSPLPGLVVHESRRHGPADIVRRSGLPTHTVERAAVDAAAWSRSPRTAAGLLAAVVQQGLSQPDRLRLALDQAGRVGHRRRMFLALADIEGGAQALSEIDVGQLCREAGLPEPFRQRVRRDVTGRRRYLDAEWQLPDGSILVLEIDGIGHMEPGRWYDDLFRQAELDLDGRHRVIRLPASAARLEPERVVAVLARALHRRPAA